MLGADVPAEELAPPPEPPSTPRRLHDLDDAERDRPDPGLDRRGAAAVARSAVRRRRPLRADVASAIAARRRCLPARLRRGGGGRCDGQGRRPELSRRGACDTLCAVDLIERLLGIDVSALSDADKTLPVVDPAVRAMIPDVRMAGPAFTVLAEDDHLPVMGALAEAAPGDVLVIADERRLARRVRRAVRHRGAPARAGRDRRRRATAATCAACARIGLPVFARGTTPRSGTTVSRAALGATIACGGVEVSPGRHRVRRRRRPADRHRRSGSRPRWRPRS